LFTPGALPKRILNTYGLYLRTLRTGAPRKLLVIEQHYVYDVIIFQNPYIKNQDLLYEVEEQIKIRTIQKLCRELGRKK
jgi:hypothetical protein